MAAPVANADPDPRASGVGVPIRVDPELEDDGPDAFFRNIEIK